jgi:hypothetical protein
VIKLAAEQFYRTTGSASADPFGGTQFERLAEAEELAKKLKADLVVLESKDREKPKKSPFFNIFLLVSTLLAAIAITMRSSPPSSSPQSGMSQSGLDSCTVDSTWIPNTDPCPVFHD